MPRTHKSLQRLYIDAPLAPVGTLKLERDQTNYLVNVLRKRPGDEVIVFNGKDGAWLASIAEAGKKSVSLSLVEQTASQTPQPDLWYGFAPIKAGRLDYMVQKATEMGVGTIQPVLTQFTQVKSIKQGRLAANAIEAAEQCEVLSVPTIAPEVKLPRLIADWPQTHAGRALIFADEAADSTSPVNVFEQLDGRPIGVLIGPEGGFSAEERALLLKQDFVVPISLGPRILRADTAAVAALAVIQSIIGDWR